MKLYEQRTKSAESDYFTVPLPNTHKTEFPHLEDPGQIMVAHGTQVETVKRGDKVMFMRDGVQYTWEVKKTYPFTVVERQTGHSMSVIRGISPKEFVGVKEKENE